ncbi:MAG: M48 family metallopeptidase [Pararhodobacter sp.]|nr:M48 family metallopeptidase [Pararhodobacter sp.]
MLQGDPPLMVHWRRSSRARQLSLRVSRLDGKITLTMPLLLPVGAARAFLVEREGWLRRALAEMPSAASVGPGSRLPVEGRLVEISTAPVRHAHIEGTALLVPQRGAPGRLARAFLQLRARDRLAGKVDGFAAQLGLRPGRLTLRDTRSRWGSCNAAGDLMFSWRLIMAPPEVLDYVAAHEVAHLAQMNHSPAFWAEVTRLMPGYAAPRRWLREQGSSLHRYRFEG